MTKIRHSFEGCGTRGGFTSGDDLIVSSGNIILGPDGGTQTTFSGTAATTTFTPGASLPAVLTDVQSALNLLANSTNQVASSRPLTNADDGKTLECTAGAITLTVPAGLEVNFGCAVIPNGTTSIASSGGTLLNGATSTLTRAAASNAAIALIQRASAADSYVVTGS